MSLGVKIVVALSALTVLVTGVLVWSQQAKDATRERRDGSPVVRPAPDFELATEKQEEIWDAEHIAFEIEHTFGTPFKAAIRSSNREQLQRAFRKTFTGQQLDLLSGESSSQSGIQETRVRNGSRAQSADANAVVSSLLSAVGGFSAVQSVRLRALDVKKAVDAVWAAQLLLTIEGIGASDEWITYESTQQVDFVFDEEVDLATKPVIRRWDVLSLLRRASKRRLFIEATKETGLDRIPLSDNWNLPASQARQYRSQFAVADFDLDGWLDIAVVDLQRCYLLQNSDTGDEFRDVSREKGIELRPAAPGLSLASWIDYDNDGYPDLLLGNRLYHNEQGSRFTEVTSYSGLEFNDTAMPMGVQVADFDCDGRLDLYILYQTYGSPETKQGWVNAENDGVENQLWRNAGGGIFGNVTTASGASGGKRKSFAATWFYYDNDHWPDLYIANDFSKNVLLRNNGDKTFTDVSEQSLAAGFATTMGVASGDVNNDGKTDIYVANMYSKMGRRILGHVGEKDYPEGYYEQILGSCSGNRLYLRSSSSDGFQEASSQQGVEKVGWAHAPTIADFDLDGRLDLYATTGFMSFDRKKPDG